MYFIQKTLLPTATAQELDNTEAQFGELTELTRKTPSWCSSSLPFVSPSPSCPKLFFPQEYTAPESDTVML